jgi:Uma2 family endonuclease
VAIAPGVGAPTRYRFTVDDWHQMIEAGVFGEDDPVELLNGEVVRMAAMGRKHVARLERAAHFFGRWVGHVALVKHQTPLVVDDGSEPEPDIALVRYQSDFYESRLATAADALLVLEVADSSLDYDLRDKALVYARSGIPEDWVENLLDDTVIVHRAPSAEGYRSREIYRRGQSLRLVALPMEVQMADLLGPEGSGS